MGLFEGFLIFKNGVDNWFSVALNMLILKREVDCKIKNIGTIRLKKGVNYLNNSLFRALVFSNTKDLADDQLEILKSYLPQIDNDEIIVTNYEDKCKLKFINKEMSLVFESFLYGDYRNIPYSQGESIIDIGGNVGDTALYFANKGYDVIALEPLPHIYAIANDNIDLNPHLKDKITFINKACSCKKEVITISFDESDTAGAGEFANASNQVDVEAVTVEDIIKEYNIKPNILKIDCEGCEVNIIRHSDLSMFKQIIFEYHTNMTGFDENLLIETLENQGFKIESQIKFKNKGMGIVNMVK